ncbi:MAG: hypothetical protein A2301_00550 [Candidatus Magasanikbacteria bacterium RIFOXYB2_FULL_40_13]|uniref:Uncharacterized protein n=1 Tax=Candidatus Magasanikbacteria bacterium RIFOXYB1_FULL_40_15 TaxID=1798697 RepID=A0A1F6NEN1_9BACT|nr:MAG: hypothetical protein A2373_02265 [Candidatus Magasanikbacteria bacterium RIFOXYB1_FULL_40_15]OGH86393.1 MAG: hypothetical protein A2301_00550 [Candidatus Magasanikbacteria bacterium RIFOXYB2_FULL_40_13]
MTNSEFYVIVSYSFKAWKVCKIILVGVFMSLKLGHINTLLNFERVPGLGQGQNTFWAFSPIGDRDGKI